MWLKRYDNQWSWLTAVLDEENNLDDFVAEMSQEIIHSIEVESIKPFLIMLPSLMNIPASSSIVLDNFSRTSLSSSNSSPKLEIV